MQGLCRISAALLVAWAFGGGCASTDVSTVWKTPQALPPPFEKVVTLVVNASPAERRAGEEELVRALRPGQGVSGYTLISDDDLKDKGKVRQIIEREGIDGAVVLRLVASDKQSTYYPPTYRESYGFGDYYGGFASYNYGPAYTASPGYTVTDTIVRTEVSVYSVRDERLLWAGAGSTTNPDDMKDLVRQTAKASAAELRKQGMLR